MFPIFTVIRTADERIETHEGTLIRVPVELRDQARIRRYALIRSPGWSRSEFGYSAYARANEKGDFYVFPGLIVANERKPDRNFGNYRTEFQKTEIESYVDGLFRLISERDERVEENLNLLIHDLRRLSGAIYHAAEEAKGFLAARDWDQLGVRLNNVTAAQAMLAIRTDIVDFQKDTTLAFNETEIPVYRRVDKVVRCFTPLANKSNIRISIQGSSFSSVVGPNLFEIIPYILIDNAVKYSPQNAEVKVLIEDKSGETRFSVNSIGPVIEEAEREHIFDKSFRGKNAINSGRPGSGIGLFLARALVARFGGTITLQQSDRRQVVGETTMTNVTFTIAIPNTTVST
ncbi:MULTISPECIES: HAMP domain-containing sensor histidine kinase [unclassified Mesorhizobium]|uniref:sensor histidine kinase n=1 Tax=unclassified Mesorhizobium TaxID=325217 RepID=UPI001093B1A6|nr:MULTISPECIES: HAMP domain-containing sensor histidine kinase [unclassified Mesorhizobium]TGS45644.1 HAMP domain-containing histidine kinase [Mesorhizobium sp. M8A.F.Ca.ET.182.01.1.1]TGS81099.1 HAMP domain-containing histidine kinase [Mesorhizobium sp. M8A.F.Ca.ET.181.01.1.1]